MNIKKPLSVVLAAAMVASFASVGASAAAASADGYVTLDSSAWKAVDEDGDAITTASGGSTFGAGSVVLDGITPNQTIYIPLGADADTTYLTELYASGTVADPKAAPQDLADTDLFKISVDKDGTGKSLIKSVTQVSNKNLGTTSGLSGRGSYLKVVLGDTTTTSDLKATIDVTFKAKKDTSSTSGHTASSEWSAGDYANMSITFWINNTEVVGSDGSAETGAAVYFNPESNEDNTFIWGDDIAALEFATDDDASSFYAKLSTKSDSTIYAEYGDPVDADLWFYDFVGTPTIPTTSRATLTLGIPWDEDDDYVPAAEDCYLYERNSDGTLTDVTDRFVYSEDTQEINGWSIKTRTLGSYVISDTELDISDVVIEDEDEDDTDVTDSTTSSGETDKEIPNTGSGDMINVALVASVVSLSAAGALAFRKASK